MKYIIVFFIISIFSCKSQDEMKKKLTISLLTNACSQINANTLASLINVKLVDIISQSNENSDVKKNCTYYKNVTPTPTPLVNITIAVDPTTELTSNYLGYLEGLLSSGEPSESGMITYKKFDIEGYRSIITDKHANFYQSYLVIDNNLLLTVEFDKSLATNDEAPEIMKKILLSILFDPKDPE